MTGNRRLTVSGAASYYGPMRQKTYGFTIVELLIVIVVIGILAAIAVVAYSGIQDRARKSVLASEVSGVTRQIELHYAATGSYPTDLSEVNSGKGVTSRQGISLRYTSESTLEDFCVAAVDGTYSYMTTRSSAPSEGSCVNLARGASSPSALITDGITTTSPWYATGANTLASVTVTLPNVEDVSMIKVWHYYGDGRTYRNTKTEVSENGSTWHTVFDSALEGEYKETAAGKTHSFPMRKVKYIRDWINGSTSNTGNHWVEIQAY